MERRSPRRLIEHRHIGAPGEFLVSDYLRMQHIADVLWERRQRRLKADGLPYETIKPEYPAGPYMSSADSLRWCLQERRARLRAEREAADNDA